MEKKYTPIGGMQPLEELYFLVTNDIDNFSNLS